MSQYSSPSGPFECFLVEKQEERTVGKVEKISTAQLPAGELLVRVAYSSLNYKDALSISGHPGVTRKFPHVPGIDAVGTVVESRSDNYRVGDEVIVTGHDQGQNTWGGFSQYIRVPEHWAVPLPEGMTLRESMIYGTAGFTAALCVDALLHRAVAPAKGEIVVTGAGGGVGSLAVAILAKLGFHVVAVSGKSSTRELLRRLGAERVISREEVVDESSKPLLPVRWAGGVDTVGGKTLGTLVRSLRNEGVVACCGLVGGADLPLTVYPFILRGVDLVGVDSAECPQATRLRLWKKLAGEWKPDLLEEIVTEITLSGIADGAASLLAGEGRGRFVVRLG